MLVRQCDRCGKSLQKKPYWQFEQRHYTDKGGYNIGLDVDLCDDCYKKFEKFMENKD